jgi:hypothetical protein
MKLFVIGCAVVGYVHPAAADVQSCLGASEAGQRARRAGRLREARDQFLLCSADACPSAVRRDCADWQGEVLAVLPSVVFGAKDGSGRDLVDVSVAMDGKPLTSQLDGKAIAIDPGLHTFTFERAGASPHVEQALVKEGEKTRSVTVLFGDVKPASSAGPSVTPPEPNEVRVRPRGHSALPWVVVGLGAATLAVGAVWYATAPAFPNGCDADSKTCTRIPDESDDDFSKRQQSAGRSEAQPTEGLIVGAAGLGVVAGGLLWHFLEPTTRSKRVQSVTPWVANGTSGVTFRTSF